MKRKSRLKKKDLQQRTARIVLTIGGILFALGLFSFVAANWEKLPAHLKVIGITGLMALFYFAGWYVATKTKHLQTAQTLQFLGFITYGMALFYAAKIFTINIGYFDKQLLWACGGLYVGSFLNYKAILYSSLVLLIFSTITRMPFAIKGESSILVLGIGIYTALFIAHKFKNKMPVNSKTLY